MRQRNARRQPMGASTALGSPMRTSLTVPDAGIAAAEPGASGGGQGARTGASWPRSPAGQSAVAPGTLHDRGHQRLQPTGSTQTSAIEGS